MSNTTDSPLAKMANAAVSVRSGTKPPSLKGRSSIAAPNFNWDENKERQVDRWTKDLQADPPDEEMLESRHGSYSGRLQKYSKPFSSSKNVSQAPSNSSRGPPPSTRFANLNRAATTTDNISRITTVHPSPKSLSTITSRPSSPVVVRTYNPHPSPSSSTSHTSRFSLSSPRIPKSLFKSNSMRSNPDAELPPVSAFSFGSIMEDIQRESGTNTWDERDGSRNGNGSDGIKQESVQEALVRIAEICARSRLSLADDYERHVRPHGPGDGLLVGEAGNGGKTATAPRRGRKGKSKAFETLETIYASSSSGNSGEGRKRKSAAELAGEVRRRRERKGKDVEDREMETERERGEEADAELSVVNGRSGELTRLGGREQCDGRCGRKEMDTIMCNGSRTRKNSAGPISNNGTMSVKTVVTSRPLVPTTTNVEVSTDTFPSLETAVLETSGQPLIRQTSRNSPPRHSQTKTQTSTSMPVTFSIWLPWLGRPTPSTAPAAVEATSDTYFDVLPSAEVTLKRILEATDKSKGKLSNREAW